MKLRKLSRGDTIALVTPASPIPAEKLEFMTGLLHDAGYRTRLMPHAMDAEQYLAGPDACRAEDLQAAFDSDEIAAVLCTRGGYGCARLFPFLNIDRMARARKMLIGFSDVTTLHVALARRGVPAVHAPMAITLNYPREPWVYESFLRVLSDDLRVPDEAPKPETVVPGIAEGPIVGGCLSLLTDTLGTPEALDTTGRILIIEAVDDPSHRVDAMLTHLINAGAIESCAGLIIGEMTRADEKHFEDIGMRPWREIVTERLAPFGKPMVIDYPFGHAKNMLTVPLGVRARLDAGRGDVTYLEGLCE